MKKLIFGGDVVTPDGIVQDGALLIDGSRILRVGEGDALPADPTIDERIDAGGRLIAPGFIDLQLNGANGRMLTAQPDPETVRAMAEILPRFGCTAVLPTAITAPVERLIDAAQAVRDAVASEPDGARVLGLHLEGPFINPERAGAHPKAHILPPSTDVLRRIWEASGGTLRLLTLAPEVDGSDDVIDGARKRGVNIAVGHCNATPGEIEHAVDRGASLATHLFNAMAQLGSRAPGTVGGALANERLSVSLIADCVHVHPVSLRVAAHAKGTAGVVLITDGMPPIGTGSDRFTLEGETILVRDGACYRPDGVLAGSVLTMDLAVRNMIQRVGVSLLDAISMASLNPARLIGVADRKGSLEAGKDADLVILERDLTVWLTMIEGRVRYRASGATAG